ncbi:hypothetical protein LINPERHAP1_LOCUS21066 [Linum perenne]
MCSLISQKFISLPPHVLFLCFPPPLTHSNTTTAAHPTPPPPHIQHHHRHTSNTTAAAHPTPPPPHFQHHHRRPISSSRPTTRQTPISSIPPTIVVALTPDPTPPNDIAIMKPQIWY